MFDVVALGELLIDFSPAGVGPSGNPSFEMNPGGAPANCLAANARMGGACAFIGMVGDDFFGHFLEQSLGKIGINAAGIVYSETIHTTIDFVSNAENGEREFAFFRKPGADMLLEALHIDYSLLDDAKIFHFGSLSLTDEPARGATYAALDKYKTAGGCISFDPNYREGLWQSAEQAVLQMKKGVEYADIIKVSLEEMTMITGSAADRIEEGAKILFGNGKKVVFVTAGANGAYYLTDDEKGFVAGYPVCAVDTTGCGDAFLGAAHFALCHRKSWSMQKIVQFANATAALCATKHAGFPAMPDYAAVIDFMRGKIK